MTEENKVKGKPVESVLSFNEAIDSRDKIIKDQEQQIVFLNDQIGKTQTIVSSYMEEVKSLADSKKALETQLAESKDLKVDSTGRSYKTEQEKFDAEFFSTVDKLKV